MTDQFFTPPPPPSEEPHSKQEGPIPGYPGAPKFDPETGEVLSTHNPGSAAMERYAPNLGNVHRAEDVAGKQIRFLNLQDNPEVFSDKSGLIVKVEYNPDGKLGEYVKMLTFLLDDAGKPLLPPVVIMTGSQNVVDRALAIKDFAKPESPVLVTFRQAGRAWLMD